jgi:hypothetical protein
MSQVLRIRRWAHNSEFSCFWPPLILVDQLSLGDRVESELRNEREDEVEEWLMGDSRMEGGAVQRVPITQSEHTSSVCESATLYLITLIMTCTLPWTPLLKRS